MTQNDDITRRLAELRAQLERIGMSDETPVPDDLQPEDIDNLFQMMESVLSASGESPDLLAWLMGELPPIPDEPCEPNMLVNPTFERWLQHVFDHPVTKPQWHFDLNAEVYDTSANPQQTTDYLRRLFESPVEHTAGYTDAQINQGINYLISNACSDHIFALLDECVPQEDRIATVQAIYTVFEQLFAPRCSPNARFAPASEEPPDTNPLNIVCYMWWDILPIHPVPNDPGRNLLKPHCLDVIERILQLPSIPCQESALHGLGHWKYGYPKRIEATIDAYLRNNPDLPEKLRAYARAARSGCVE